MATYAYVGYGQAGGGGLKVIDVSDPASPTVLGSLSGTGGAPNWLKTVRAVVVRDDLAYCAVDYDHSLTIVDVTDPTSLSTVGHIAGFGAPNFLSNPQSIYLIRGKDYAIVGSAVDGLTVIDISDATAPAFVANLPAAANLLTGLWDICIVDSIAYCCGRGDGAFVLVDISVPTNPFRMGYIQGFNDGSPAREPDWIEKPRGVKVLGNYAYVTVSHGLTIVNIATPYAPITVGNISGFAPPTPLETPYGVDVSANIAYVASSQDDALSCINVSNPATPSMLGYLSNHESASNQLDGAYRVKVLGNYAYVTASQDDRLTIVDISTPSAPVTVGSVLSGLGSRGLALPQTQSTIYPACITDRVTGIITRVGPGYYGDELILGGLTSNWNFVDWTQRPTPTMPTQEGWLGPYFEITDEGMLFFWLLPDGSRKYIQNIEDARKEEG